MEESVANAREQEESSEKSAANTKELEKSLEESAQENVESAANARELGESAQEIVQDSAANAKLEESAANTGHIGLTNCLEEAAAATTTIHMASSSTSVKGAEERVANEGPPEDEFLKYLPLYRAAARGDWEMANLIFQQDEGAITAIINNFKQTALHVAIEMGRNIHFVEELVKLMPKQDLLLKDDLGNTALTLAAIAARYSRRQIVSYLLDVASNNIKSCPFGHEADVLLLNDAIISKYFDIAVELVEKYPHLATLKVVGFLTPLEVIAQIPSAFRRGCKLKYWEGLIYDGIPLSLLESHPNKNEGDVENATCNSAQVLPHASSWNYFHLISVMWQELRIMIWKTIIHLGNKEIGTREACLKFFLAHILGNFLHFDFIAAPPIKQIKDKKQMHNHALQLVKLICKRIETLNNLKNQETHYANAVTRAASVDNSEVIEEIVEIFPNAVRVINNKQDGAYMFHLAVGNRSENVFNLAYQMDGNKHRAMNATDNYGNTILHIAGRLAKPQKLNLVSGAALQMQRELQWFEEVERWLRQDFKEKINKDGKTPQMIFTEEHKNLVIDGEKWMRDTANSCAIVASLIVTIVFAAAITVPGGNKQDNGQPVLFKRNGFIIFAISDAISLFSSATSLLMFLAILTSRYAEMDFLYALPKKLIIGLVTLFLSITFMIIAFCCTLYLVFGRGENWVLIGVAILASLPITSFVFQQFPLLVDLISSTYGPGIFGKRIDRPFG
ncbi:hypothetical protein NMG60_11029565 [Bertholletia excelsa]